MLDLLAALAVGDDDGEFVAAHAPDVAVAGDLVDQPLGDFAQDRVALGVAVGVVDRLEAVEVEEHDRAGHIVDRRGAQGLAEQLADAAAVGQARQHVDIGEVGQALLGLADLGDVGADAAEAFEPAGGIDDGIARHGDPARPALGLQFHLERIERLLLDQYPAKLGMAAEQRGQRVADELGAGAAEQHAHARADVADAIFIIDLPQPADAALLIFEQQLAGAFALRADIGIGLELLEGPAGHRQNAENRHAEGEHQRQHVLEGNGVAGDEQSADDAGGEDHHPGGNAGGNDDQPERRDPKARHQRSREQLRSGAKGREQVKRKRQPDERSNRDFTDQQPLRHDASRPADASDGLRAGQLHRAEVERRDRNRPAEQQPAWRGGIQVHDENRRGGNIGEGEEGREMRPRDQLPVAQRRIFGIGPAGREAGRFPTGKTGRNEPFVSVWCLVHGPHAQLISQCPIQRELMAG